VLEVGEGACEIPGIVGDHAIDDGGEGPEAFLGIEAAGCDGLRRKRIAQRAQLLEGFTIEGEPGLLFALPHPPLESLSEPLHRGVHPLRIALREILELRGIRSDVVEFGARTAHQEMVLGAGGEERAPALLDAGGEGLGVRDPRRG
jgi:hypothetical protein